MFYQKSIICTLAMFFVISCSNNSQEATASSVIKKISAQELVQIQEEKPNLLIVDVRTPNEISAGGITNAKFLDFYSSNFEANLQKLDNKRPIVVYCKSGGRSGKTTKVLEKLGFTEIYDLENGYKSWLDTQ